MPKVAARRKDPDYDVYEERTQVSSVIFGLVMVVAIIVAGAALLGGSLSQAGKRWGNAMDGVSRSLGLSVASVEVVGLEHVPPVARKVIDAAMIEEGENMFRADPHLIRGRVEATRLVTNVRVYRLWPDTVMIRADAVQASALWYDGEVWQVVDNLGQVMPRARVEDHIGLIETAGTGAPESLGKLQTALAFIRPLRDEVSLARRVADRRWELDLKSGATLKLPVDEKLSEGLNSLARLNAQGELLRRHVADIDARVPGRVFLKPKPAAATVEEAA